MSSAAKTIVDHLFTIYGKVVVCDCKREFSGLNINDSINLWANHVATEIQNLPKIYPYLLTDTPKMVKETINVAQQAYGQYRRDYERFDEHMARLSRIVEECDRMRPVGRDGKHNNRHTEVCGCDGR